MEFGSGCGAVLVDESGAGCASFDQSVWIDGGDGVFVIGRTLVESAVGPVCVVVLDVFIE